MKSRWTVACIALALTAFAGQGTASAAFHTAEGKAGNSLSGSASNVIFTFLGAQVICEASGLLGVTSGGAPNTQDLAPTFSNCYGWSGWTVNTKGCKFRFDQFEEATLHGCSNYGLELTMGTSCTVFVPNQTVPAHYKNGAENAYLDVSFSGAQFTGELRKATAQCPLPKESNFTGSLSGDFKVVSVGGFWFDPTETEPSEFHAAASALITGTRVGESTAFQIGDYEAVECESGGLFGDFPASASAETLGVLAVDSGTSDCDSPSWGDFMSIDATGCNYVLHADGTADLKSCSGGSMSLIASFPPLFYCEVVIPNQTGVSDVSYRNLGAYGSIAVRGTLDLSFSAEVVKSSGFCTYELGEKLTVSQENVLDFHANWGGTEVWFG